MKKVIFLLSMFLFVKPTFAADFENAVGIGLQFGGVVGYQLSTTVEQGRIRGALGIVGASIGYDHFVTDTFAIGATITATLRTVYSLNLNYMPAGQQNSGWMFAVDLGHMQDTDGDGFFTTDGPKNVIWFSTGYRF
ncbi:MAG: hypothetical protein ACI88A_000450 [Paraglaciecola sp.]|jgi:hypothetical protein